MKNFKRIALAIYTIVMARSITDEDNANTRPVAVITEGFAKRCFGKENPIGRQFGTPQPPRDYYSMRT